MIKQYTIISSITEKPLRYCQCPESDIGNALKENEYAVEGRVEASKTQQELFNVIRLKRDALLFSSDWTQLPDAPLSPTVKGWWASYRQQLRDIPANVEGITNIDQVQWPTEP